MIYQTVVILNVSLLHAFTNSYVFRKSKNFFSGRCLSTAVISALNNVHWCFKDSLVDLGIVALALLASDRYLAIKTPVAYMAKSDKTRIRWCIGAAVLTFLTNGIQFFTKLNKDYMRFYGTRYGSMIWWSGDRFEPNAPAEMFMELVRTGFLTVSVYW
jgi:hypothetical protein